MTELVLSIRDDTTIYRFLHLQENMTVPVKKKFCDIVNQKTSNKKYINSSFGVFFYQTIL